MFYVGAATHIKNQNKNAVYIYVEDIMLKVSLLSLLSALFSQSFTQMRI
jgi:hypothetical protein